jgi:hypothetical protein
MPSLPWQDLSSPEVSHALSTIPFKLPDFQAVLSDALLSLSPLATLVGADGVRALMNRATNLKQSLLVSLAPIGALGMIATIIKASDMMVLKDMLGSRECDIHDAAREMGCGGSSIMP